MYAVYNYKAGATQANVLADLVKIITGETNKANLSADCVQANTTIASVVPAGWSVWDAAAGTNLQVLRALNQDATTYKYMGLTLSSTTAFSTYAYEGWNATTHAATNATAAASSTWNSAGGGYFYVYATPKNCVIMPWTATGYQYFCGCIEISRDTIPAGYPCFGSLYGPALSQNNAVPFYIPRIKSFAGAGDYTGSSAQTYLGAVFYCGINANVMNSQQIYRDAAEALYLATYKIGASTQSTYIHLGVVSDLLITGYTAGNALDQISYGGTTYVLFKSLPGQSSLLVPLA